MLLFFLIFAQNMDFEYTLEPPQRGGFNEYPQSMFCEKMRKISEFLSENCHLTAVYCIGMFV